MDKWREGRLHCIANMRTVVVCLRGIWKHGRLEGDGGHVMLC